MRFLPPKNCFSGFEGGVPQGVPQTENHLGVISIANKHFLEAFRKNRAEWGSAFYTHPLFLNFEKVEI
jgi:hypothetical protein